MKGKRNFVRRVIALLAVCAMTVTSLPMIAMAEGTEDERLVLHYDFESLKSGTIVNDVSGKGLAGVVCPAGSEVQTQTDLILGQEHTSFIMNGGQPDATHTYVEMPQGVLNGLEDVTISCWVYLNASDKDYRRIWDIGSDTTSYMYLLVDGNNEGHKGYTSAITASGWSNEKGPQKESALETGRWIFTTVTFDGSEKSMSLYEDGKLIGISTTDADLSALQGSTKNYIGFGQFENDIMDGRIADFKIYNYAMTADEIAAQVNLEDAEKVKRDKETLTLGDISAVTENMTLPSKGSAGSDVTWSSDNEDVIAADGTVKRPASDQEDVKVTLTATITAGTETATKTFEVTVKRGLNAKETAEADAAAIDLGNLGSVKENLVLPVKGTFGSDIEWSSSDETVLTSAGVVKRPEAETKVTLTAAVTYEGETATREFEVTVMPSYTKVNIKEVKPVSVESSVGKLPNLPATVSVVYDNDATGTEKVIWPTNLSVADFSAAGTKVITGTIVGTDVNVTASVTITDKAAAGPEKAASSFELSDITLDGTDTIYGQNAGRAFEYLKVMDADRMLYNFRRTFGQDTKGAQALTGWDEPTGLLRGHSTGHFMSALALAYASTGDKEYKDKLDYMITEMAKLQALSQGKASEFKTQCTPGNAAQNLWSTDPSAWGEGFISAYSPDQFALLEQYTPYATIWAPYYTLHKLFAGFIDSYTYAGNIEGLEIAKKLGLWVYDRLSACTPEQRTRMWAMYIAGEYGGMNEVLAKLYEITKDERYLEAAKMFDNTEFFDGLANNVDTIQGRHANQHIPQIVGAVHEYAASGDAKYYNIAQNFWEMTISRYAYSIGGVGTGERFKDPYQQGNNILGNAGRGENCETCAAYNLLKLTMDLYNYNPDDASYMDYYERTLINQIAASQSHDTTSYMHNGCTYMLPIDPGQRKDYDSDYGGFTCCNGTGMENHVKYQAAAYAHTADTLYVNLYMPTTVNWKDKNITVKQETKFPSEHSRLTVTGNGTFTMKLRVPYWATEGFTVKVNDEVAAENPQVSSYVEINRNWSDGDVVTVDMPYTLHLDKTPDKVDESTVASLMYGPIVMVAKDQNSSYTAMNWYNIVLSSKLSESVDVVVGADQDAVPQLSTNGLQFYPMYDAYNYRYHAYLKIDEAGAPVDKASLQALVDSVTGDNAPAKENYGPKSYRELQKAIAAAQAALLVDPTTQAQINKARQELQDAIDGLKPAQTPDQNNLAASADITVSYCSTWEKESAVNDGQTGSVSVGTDCSHWGTWGNWDAEEEWISYEWAVPVFIDTSEVYFFDNSNGGDGGVQVPSSYRYEYLNDAGEWAAVPNAQGLETEQDRYNVTTFDTIKTTGIRAVLVKKAAGVGINEWKVSGKPVEEGTVLLDFTFDDAETGFKGGKAVAAPAGTVTEIDGRKALYLDGTNTNWLNVTKEDGSSLLTGVKEMTASFDIRTEGSNWPFFAAPDANEQKWSNESYIGVMAAGNLAVERYKGGRAPVTETALTKNDWVSVKLVLTEDNTQIYVNDELQAEQSSEFTLTDILGDASVLQIGKANWTAAGEYFKGYLDNYKIVATKIEVNKEALQAAVDAAPADTEKENYSKESWAVYAEALDAAKAVLEKESAMQEEVDAAKAALEEAVKGLTADKTALQAAVDGAKTNAEDYTEESWALYQAALTKANEVLGKEDATQKEVDAAKAALSAADSALAKKQKPILEVLADFNFDADGEFFDGGNAKAAGTYTLEDHGTGKALKLDGNGQHLVVTDKDGNSLLTGVKEMTVSYQIRPENSKTNWGFFAAPNANKQEYEKEHYLGIVDISGTTRAERYNGGTRPAVAGYATGYNGWYHVTAVYTEGATALYVDGVKVAEEASEYALADILGENSILYIGKSTWVEGEYATALIDNYKIISHALTAEEIAKEAVKYVEKDALKAAIDAEVDGKDTYTSTTWKAYEDALAAANTVYDKADVTQAEVNEAAVALTGATAKLVKRGDKTALQEAIKNAVPAEEKEKYTQSSWEAYEKALDKAKEVEADADATERDVTNAVRALENAKNKLEEAQAERPFEDVDKVEGEWYYDAVYYNFDREIMNGVDPTHFEPLSNLARAQFAIILHNMEGKPGTAYEPKFKDVEDKQWYTEAIMWASSKEIVTGYTDGSETFGWGDNILREQMAVMMYRYAKNFKDYDVSDSADFDKFEDAASVSEYAKEAMKWAVGSGIITGKYEGTKIDPQSYASRAECAIIIQRFLEKYN